tara:strand:- start:1355 stop:1654 length:300 start_codon:yes stop_codon:yes gene_type:complete
MFKFLRLINIYRMVKNSYKYFFNPRIPKKYKLIPIFAFFYFIIPLDILPELRILGIGYFDDLFIVYLLLRWFENLCEKFINKQSYIEADYEIKEKEEDK